MAINKQHFMCWVVVYSCWRALYVNNRLLQFIIDESVQAFLPLNMANMFFAKRSKKNPKNPKYVLLKKSVCVPASNVWDAWNSDPENGVFLDVDI